LREPTDDDWKGRLRNIAFDVTMYIPEFRNVLFLVDEVWARDECARRGFSFEKVGTFQRTGDGSDFIFEGEDGTPLATLNNVCNGLAKAGGMKVHDWERRRRDFSEPTYLATGDSAFPRLRLATCEVEVMQHRT